MTPGAGTRERIIEAARTLLAQRPSASAEEVAAAASVSRATFYRHFRSRDDLLAELELEPDPGSRGRVLAAAAELIGRDGLSALSMDELAATAGVSRATVYRLFPGKAALFGAVIDAFGPYQPIIERLEQIADRPPDVVLPELYRVAAVTNVGRVGILRAMFVEITSGAPEAVEGSRRPIGAMLQALGGYLERQIDAGRIRRMHPTLAAQILIGPMLFHLFTRPIARERGLDIPVEVAAAEIVATLLQGFETADAGPPDPPSRHRSPA